MHEPAVTLSVDAYARVQDAIDAASGAIAGFALLALVGWMRWCLCPNMSSENR